MDVATSPRPRLAHNPHSLDHFYRQQQQRNEQHALRFRTPQYAQQPRGSYVNDPAMRPVAPENMLRRKTPNGTLYSAYESSNHDAQAAKHMLLSRNEGVQHACQIPQVPQMDSVLHQQAAFPSRHMHSLPHPFYGQSFPSVMQPPSQYLGPTASGIEGRGPYGPYWNDGTYVPYRPAALRDPRFYAQHDLRYPAHGYSPPWNTESHGLVYPTSSRPWSAYGNGMAAIYPSFAGVHDLPYNPDFVPNFGPSPANAQQREHAFNWALQTYRELLAYIHQVRKVNHQMKTAYQSSSPQPRFYPKPPKMSGTPLLTPPHLPHPTHSEGSTPINGEPLRRHDVPKQFPFPPTPFQSAPNHLPTPLPMDNSPPTRATTALNLITRLCEETTWQWVDGIHLAGCISYGLSCYQKAEKFYTTVLTLDPRHVEAMSNLAATLVALERKQEAEEHWMKVVKLAPNYFEAVEHLVGLFCSTSRGKDAIKVIDFVERSLRISKPQDMHKNSDHQSEISSNASRSPCVSDASDKASYDFETEGDFFGDSSTSKEPGFGSSGYAIPGADNGRILALVHAKGNMLYTLGENAGAAKAFEDAVLVAVGRKFSSIPHLVRHILLTISALSSPNATKATNNQTSNEPILLYPEQAANTARLCFSPHGELTGLRHLPSPPSSPAKNAAIAIASNSLLSLAKIFQDSMARNVQGSGNRPMVSGVREILALYYLSLSLQPSPSTANNVGILLAGVQQSLQPTYPPGVKHHEIPGVIPGSGISLALAYYNYGLVLDSRHAHLYTNLGSLLKDIGQLDAAIEMYKRAIQCDGKFDIALANLANAVKDKGRIADAIGFYKRAVDVNPDFAEAVCGLANALNSVCGWQARGGISSDGGKRDRWHVDQNGMLLKATLATSSTSGWINRVVSIVEKQLKEGEYWGCGTLTPSVIDTLVLASTNLTDEVGSAVKSESRLRENLHNWAGQKWEGARLIKLLERIVRCIGWRWYQDKYVHRKQTTSSSYLRPQLPASLTVPNAPTVLPFHTFTCPVSAKQVRLISERNAYRISTSTMRMPWLPAHVYPPPAPPAPHLKVGYVSSDFNNHPLAHLMQSVFSLHDQRRVEAFCYATTASDNSAYRRKIEEDSPNFYDVSSWPIDRLVNQIVKDGIHILVNLNGYTRGARNEVFAARAAPIQMSFMGFAGTLGAEWCDYLLADETAVPPSTLRPWRGNVDVEDRVVGADGGEEGDWVYSENLIYCRDTFFCCDHRQSAPDSQERVLTWEEEQDRRWKMRKEIFPALADDVVIFGNFNQLYKIDPTTFRTWLRILAQVPNSILWLLRFPDLGEAHLKRTAELWACPSVAARIVFTDVAPKHLHISRARVCDLFLDTAECNAHTTAADCLWSGTPLLTLPRYEYKMCSRMAASILKGALPKDPKVRQNAERDLIASTEDEYEELAIRLGKELSYPKSGPNVGRGEGRLVELRKILTEGRWSSALFDTTRWTRDLEDAYDEAWKRWVNGQGGDIWLEQIPRGGRLTEVEH